jgi:uncharacterized membrane protein
MDSKRIQDSGIGCLERFESWLTKRLCGRERTAILVLSFLITYTAVFSSLSVYRHYAYNTHAWDLGIFTQSLWTTLNSNRFLYYTCELIVNPSGSFFGVHFSPLLFFILPVYGVLQAPETLLVLQSFILALASIPIYKLARAQTGKRTVGVAFALAYLLYPSVHHVNVYEFHVQSFLPLFFGCAVYFLSKEDWPKYFVFVLLALMCEEHVAWIVFFLGIYVGWKHRIEVIQALKKRAFTNRKLIIAGLTILLSLGWYWFTLWQRDTFFPSNPATMAEFLGSDNFKILGASNPLEVPLLIILRPFNALQALAYDGPLKLFFLLSVFGPLAFLSLKSPSSLLPIVPSLVFSLFSQSAFHHILGTQYPAYLTFFVFAAAIFGLNRKPNNIKKSLKLIIGSSLVFFILVSPLSPIVSLFPTNYKAASLGDHERTLTEVLGSIPDDASILTQDNVFPHVSHRVDAFVIPDRWIHSGGIREIAVEFVNRTADHVEYVLVDSKTDQLAYEVALLVLSDKPQFTLETSEDGGTILLFRQRLP